MSWLGFLVGKVGGWSPWELVGNGTRSVIVWNSGCMDDDDDDDDDDEDDDGDSDSLK